MTARTAVAAVRSAPAEPQSVHGSAVRATMRSTRRWRLGVGAMALVTAVVTAWGSWSSPVVSYYAAAALSMSRSWSNFLLGAMDPAGTITVDKIPGGLWPAAAAVRIFGYSPAAVILPEVLAAAAAAIVAAVTARRLAGPIAGMVAAAAVSTTPILVAVSRSNQPESVFVLTLALTAWAAVHAAQDRSLGWLLVAGVFIAAGFQVYMLLAWAAWPPLVAAYACTRQSWLRRILHTLCAGTLSVALSLVWVVAVWLMPAGTRPYLGSTVHDSPWELVFGYNGLGRFTATADPTAYRSFAAGFSGPPRLSRLVGADLAGQIAWLLPAAALAVLVLVVLRAPLWIPVLLGGWVLMLCAALSAVAGMHEFAAAALAVPVPLVVATAFGWALHVHAKWVAAVLVAASALAALGIAMRFSAASLPIALVQAGAAAAGVTLLWRGRRWAVAGLAVVGMLLTPAVWSLTTVGGVAVGDPVAGGPLAESAPASATTARTPASASPAPAGAGDAVLAPGDDGALLRYVDDHAGTARYRIAVFGAQRAAVLIVLSRGQSVLPIGGYSGADPAPTLDAFTAMVQARDVRFVQVPVDGVDAPVAGSQAGRILSWVTADCRRDASAPVADVYACARR